jgi:hypothetical protein
MRAAIIENEYDISLGTSFFIDTPVLKKDWLYLILYFDEVYSLLSGEKYEKYNLITIKDFPLEIVNRKFLQSSPTEHIPLELNTVDFCLENGLLYIKPVHYSERDEFLYNIEKELPKSLTLLKKSFLIFDILNFFITNYISDIGEKFESDLLFELSAFKHSDMGIAFQDGIDFLTERYSPNYYLTPPVENDLKDFFLREQNELFKKTDIEKIKSFDLSTLFEDGAGVVGSLIIPVLPISTIKELFGYFKNSKDFKNDRFLLFVLSFYYIQKIISKYTKVKSTDSRCSLCSLTVSEIDKMTEEQAHDFVFKHSGYFCLNHKISYLNNRKFNRLVGRALLINMKKDG